MRRRTFRLAAIAVVLGATVLAYAIGNGDITATPEVDVVVINTATGGGTSTTTLQNTSSATSYNVFVGSDATCDPMMMFSVIGGNPTLMSPTQTRQVSITCPSRGTAAMRRCLYHATNNANATPLADFAGLCLYGASPGTLTPLATTLDFGTVTVGDSAHLQLDIRNDGTQTITHAYLATSDIDGNFQLSTPCNPDATFCDGDLSAPITAGNNIALQIRCTPQTPGVHTAQLFVGTNTFQLMMSAVTLTCTGGTPTAPVLAVNPTSITMPAPIEATSGNASTVVHLANAGVGTLMINDVRTVDVDTGAAADWTYSASGGCTGQITSPCSLDSGKQVDINLRFDPNAIGRRRATLLISYHDTVDRTKEIALEGTGLGGTLQLASGATSLSFGMVPIGRASQLDFSLINRGNRDVSAQVSLAAATTPPFTLSPLSATVVPNIERTITATCTPAGPGTFSTTITAGASDAFMSPATTLSATCEGSSLQLFAAPTAVQLGEIRLGTSVRRTVQLLSVGGALTLVGQPALETPDSGNVSLGALNQTVTPASFDVTITPQAEGQLNHTIVISDSDGETLRIPLSGKAVRAEYTVAPMLDLGTFCVGQPTTSSNVALLASGTATIGVMQPSLAQSPSPFQLAYIAPSGYPSTLPAGTSARLAVTPQRQMNVTTLSDTLTWRTDVAAAPTATTMLTAKFLDSGGAIAPPTLDFGKVTVHLYSDNGQRVMIQNCNPTPLMLDPPMIKTPFSIDSPNFPGMLNPNETTTFSLGFHPTRIGVVTETLRITSPQLPNAALEVTVTGEGVSPDSGDAGVDGGTNGFGNTSFYSCSCTSRQPGGGAPILFAFLYVLRRRLRGSRRTARDQDRLR